MSFNSKSPFHKMGLLTKWVQEEKILNPLCFFLCLLMSKCNNLLLIAYVVTLIILFIFKANAERRQCSNAFRMPLLYVFVRLCTCFRIPKVPSHHMLRNRIA